MLSALASADCLAKVAAKTADPAKKPTGYADVPWGASEKELREKLHMTNEWDCLAINDVQHCQTHFDLGDYAVMVTLDLIDDKFGRVTMSFWNSEWDQMNAAFLQKYGPPQSSATVPVRTTMNVPYTNVVMTWRWADVDARLERYGDTVDKGFASITTTAFRRAVADADERAKKRAAKAPF
jgi:hypothetical protein